MEALTKMNSSSLEEQLFLCFKERSTDWEVPNLLSQMAIWHSGHINCPTHAGSLAKLRLNPKSTSFKPRSLINYLRSLIHSKYFTKQLADRRSNLLNFTVPYPWLSSPHRDIYFKRRLLGRDCSREGRAGTLEPLQQTSRSHVRAMLWWNFR